jgi:hypothetical protein
MGWRVIVEVVELGFEAADLAFVVGDDHAAVSVGRSGSCGVGGAEPERG